MVAKEKKILVRILHTYPKTLNSPFCYLLICLNIDVWSNAAFCGIWSMSTLFAKAYLSQCLGLLWFLPYLF